MKTIHFLSLAFLLAGTASCNSGIDTSEDKAAGAPAHTATPQPLTGPQQPAANTPTAGTSAALNPAHGQPGHRCELPVGAPLNSTSAPAMAPGAAAPLTLPGNASPQRVQVAPSMPQGNAKGSTARLNPAHGQPGHDCNVPVGQPLK
jgi:hypothetical protein